VDRSFKTIQLEGLAQRGSILETPGYIVFPVAARENERNRSLRENFRDGSARRSSEVDVEDGNVEARIVRKS
jgi:hypothetical protein